MKIKIKLSKRLSNAYKNYKKRYRAAAKMLAKRGKQMESKMLNLRSYLMTREAYIDEGQKININQTIVADQKYKYSYRTARQFKKVATEMNLDWQEESVFSIRKGAVDVSALNNILKQQYPEWTSYQRRDFITTQFFGGSK